MAADLAIPASVAGDLAVAASKAVGREQNAGREYTAEELAEAAAELIQASREPESMGDLVSVDAKLVQAAAAFDETDGRSGARSARPFLENAGRWDER